MKLPSAVLLSLLTLGLTAPAFGAAGDKDKEKSGKIKKCQDETGKWHYGDTAAQECAKSKVTEISEKGTKKKEIDAPPTEAELADRERRKEGEERERHQAEERARRDQILLSTYAHEDDIVYVRDRKIAQIENAIKASEETLNPLRAALARMETQQAGENKKGDKTGAEQSAKHIPQTKAQIARHEGVIADKRKEQEAIRKEAETDLARYREIKRKK